MAAVAAAMTAEGAVDRRTFRRRCEADVDLAGWADGELERLFELLRKRLVEAGATLDARALTTAFALLRDEARRAHRRAIHGHLRGRHRRGSLDVFQ